MANDQPQPMPGLKVHTDEHRGDHHVVRDLSREEDVEDLAHILDDGLPTHALSQQAADLGVNV